MSRLLDPVRALVADLIRKRLWPLALLLVIALVAVPVFIASSSSSEAPPPGGAAVAAAPDPAPAAAPADRASAVEGEPAGRVRDPFFDPPAAPSSDKPSAQASGTASAAKPEQSAAKTPAAKPAGAGGATTGSTKAAKPRSPGVAERPAPPVKRSVPATGYYHRTAASLGAGTNVRTLSRLTPVAGRDDPAAIYLGVMKVGAPYAVFALGRHVTSGGDGTCAVETGCRIVGLRPGDTQTFSRRGADGRLLGLFVVHVTSVTRLRTSAARASAMRMAVHPHGLSALRAMSRSSVIAETIGRLGYRRSSGLLYSVAAADALEQAAR